MSFSAIEKIADAVLYEGYILYPYRPSSIKNQQRWNFGTLYPKDFALAREPREPWRFRTEFLVQGSESTCMDARVRFLQLVAAGNRGQGAEPTSEQTWEQGFARFRTVEDRTMAEICSGIEVGFDLRELTERERETAPPDFAAPDLLAESGVGTLELSGQRLADGLYRLRAVFANETPLSAAATMTRRSAQAAAFTSAHLLLHVRDGAFVSALDPPPQFAAAVGSCGNEGVFPVLAGAEGERAYMLVSPIILYDYPQIAPESPGDFFDGTEMDEMLALRVLTLTDAEHEEMRRSDPHARAILERMETLPEEHLLKVHGAMRGLRPVQESAPDQDPAQEIDAAIQPWNPFEERPPVDAVRIFGMEVRKGHRVRLWPQSRVERNMADILDLAMEGKTAVVESIVQDLEDRIQLAVVLDDDPGRDLGLLQKAGHRFFFTPEEIEPLGVETV